MKSCSAQVNNRHGFHVALGYIENYRICPLDDFVEYFLLLGLIMLSEGLRVPKPVSFGFILFIKIICVFILGLVLVEKRHIFIPVLQIISNRELLDDLECLGINRDVIVRWIFNEDGPIRYSLIFFESSVHFSDMVQSFDRFRCSSVD